MWLEQGCELAQIFREFEFVFDFASSSTSSNSNLNLRALTFSPKSLSEVKFFIKIFSRPQVQENLTSSSSHPCIWQNIPRAYKNTSVLQIPLPYCLLFAKYYRFFNCSFLKEPLQVYHEHSWDLDLIMQCDRIFYRYKHVVSYGYGVDDFPFVISSHISHQVFRAFCDENMKSFWSFKLQ